MKSLDSHKLYKGDVNEEPEEKAHAVDVRCVKVAAKDLANAEAASVARKQNAVAKDAEPAANTNRKESTILFCL